MIVKLDTREQSYLEEIYRVQRASYAIEAKLIGTDAIPPLHETLEELQQAEENFRGFVLDGKLIGFVATQPEDSYLRISRMCVDPEFFKNGIGKALLQNVLNTRTPGMPLIVSTGEQNVPARNLYERFGFVLSRTFDAGGVMIAEYTRK